MRVPLRRAGTALLVAGLALMSAAVTLLVVASSPRSAGSGAAGGPSLGQNPAAPSPGVSDSSGPPSAAPGPSTGGDAQASPRTAQAIPRTQAPPAVTLTGVAGLPSAKAHAGYDTPADAVDGFYEALLGGTPTQACAYATSPCPSFGSGRITGSVNIADAVSQGDEALVEVTGTICRATTCVPLNDRIVMPTGPASFSAAWASLISAGYGWAASPLLCVRDSVTGRWLVKLS